jgi:pyruvate/2-oxoglutarate dehydrogenase complex dihydrolipoamide acyltransferase (E2) component
MRDYPETAKSLFDVIRQLLIIGILVSLVVFPSFVGLTLERMGIQEADIWGWKWKRNFVNTDKTLVEMQAENRDLIQKLQRANDTLALQTKLLAGSQGETASPREAEARPAIVEEAKRVVEQNTEALTRAKTAAQSAQQTIVANSPLIARAQELGYVGTSQFGIVIGSDVTEAAARDELKRAQAANLDPAKIFERQGWYATVVMFPNRDAATSNLATVQDKAKRPDAFVVDLSNWCATQTPVGNDLIECGKS